MVVDADTKRAIMRALAYRIAECDNVLRRIERGRHVQRGELDALQVATVDELRREISTQLRVHNEVAKW